MTRRLEGHAGGWPEHVPLTFALQGRVFCAVPPTSRQSPRGQGHTSCGHLPDTSALEHPGVPLPVGSTSTVHTGEAAVVSDLSCGGSWTVQLAGEVPDDAWDHTDTDRPGTMVLFTLYQSSNAWVSVSADAANNRLSFRVKAGTSDTTVHVTAPSPYLFYFLRGSPILVAIKCVDGNLFAFASVGGTPVAGPVEIFTSTTLEPDQLRFGDTELLNLQPMLWYGGRIDDDAGLSDTTVRTSLRELGMLYELDVRVPPGM